MTVVFLPLCVWRLLAVKDWRDQTVTASYGLGLGIQAWAYFHFVQPTLTYTHAPLASLGKLFGLRVGLGLFSGTRFGSDLWRQSHLLALLAVVALMSVLILLWRNAPFSSRVLALYCCGASLLLFAYPNWDRYLSFALAPNQDPMFWNSRYAYAPILLIIFAIGLLADRIATRPGAGRTALAIGVIVVFALWTPGLRSQSSRTTEQPWTVALSSALSACRAEGEIVTVPIAPIPWTAQIECPGRTGVERHT
jgi:hypothetical protein